MKNFANILEILGNFSKKMPLSKVQISKIISWKCNKTWVVGGKDAPVGRPSEPLQSNPP